MSALFAVAMCLAAMDTAQDKVLVMPVQAATGVTEEQQWAKMREVVEIADEVWGK